MFEHYEAAAVRPGKLRRVRLEMLPGAPEIDVEHLGETNKTWLAEMVGKAGTNPVQVVGTGPGGAQTAAERAEQLERFRGILASHGVRHLVSVRRADGTPAVDADIARWCAAIPPDVVTRLVVLCFDVDKFRDGPEVDAETLAGKS